MVDFEKYIAAAVKCRDKMAEMAERHKAEKKPLADLMEKLEGIILAGLQSTNQESAKTANGTAYITTKDSATLEDADEFMRHVIGAEDWSLLDRRANVVAIRAHVADNGALPPGVKFTSRTEVNIRRPTGTK